MPHDRFSRGSGFFRRPPRNVDPGIIKVPKANVVPGEEGLDRSFEIPRRNVPRGTSGLDSVFERIGGGRPKGITGAAEGISDRPKTSRERLEETRERAAANRGQAFGSEGEETSADRDVSRGIRRARSGARRLQTLGEGIALSGLSRAGRLLKRAESEGRVSPEQAADRALIDSAASESRARGINLRNLSRAGVSPESGRFAGLQARTSLQFAAQRVGAANRAQTQARTQNFRNTLALVSPRLAMAGQGAALATAGARTQAALADEGGLSPFQQATLERQQRRDVQATEQAEFQRGADIRGEARAERKLSASEAAALQSGKDKLARGERLNRTEERAIRAEERAQRTEERTIEQQGIAGAARTATRERQGVRDVQGRLDKAQSRLDSINRRFDKKNFQPSAADLADLSRAESEVDRLRAQEVSTRGGTQVSPGVTQAARLFGELGQVRGAIPEPETGRGSGTRRFFGKVGRGLAEAATLGAFQSTAEQFQAQAAEIEGQINQLFSAGSGAGQSTPAQVITQLQADNPNASIEEIIQGAIDRGLILER